MTPAIAYVRSELPARYLPGKVELLGRHSLCVREDGSPWFTNQEGVAVWHAPGTHVQARMIEGMLAYGIPTFVDVDDNYLGSSWAINVGTWSRSAVPNLPSSEIHKKICREVDGVICASAALCELYRRENSNVSLVRNAVCVEDWPDPDKPSDRTGVVTVGVAMSESHRDGLLVATDALREASLAGARVVAIGTYRHEWEFDLEVVPWIDSLEEYRRQLGSIDILVVPIAKNTRWAHYHSDLKLLEAGMAGCAVVCSDAEPYREWKSGDCVLKVSSPREMADAVVSLIEDMDRARALSSQLRCTVISDRTIDLEVSSWKTALFGLGQQQGSTPHTSAFSTH